MDPAFGSTVIKDMAPVLFDTTHKVSRAPLLFFSLTNTIVQLKAAWDKLLDSKKEGSTVEVELHDWFVRTSAMLKTGVYHFVVLFPGC